MADKERKEKVIHTRVPDSLDDEIRKRAASLGVSVSNLVRNVLGHAFGLVEDVIIDGAAVAESVSRKRRRAPDSPVPSYGGATPTPEAGVVLGWQRLLMNINAVCAACNAIVAKGREGALGVIEGSGPRPVLCLSCLEERSHDHGDANPDDEPAGAPESQPE